MAAAKPRADKSEIAATQRANAQSRALAETLPRLILEARRVADMPAVESIDRSTAQSEAHAPPGDANAPASRNVRGA